MFANKNQPNNQSVNSLISFFVVLKIDRTKCLSNTLYFANILWRKDAGKHYNTLRLIWSTFGFFSNECWVFFKWINAHCVCVKFNLVICLKRSETHANVEMLQFPPNEKFQIQFKRINEYCVIVVVHEAKRCYTK